LSYFLCCAQMLSSSGRHTNPQCNETPNRAMELTGWPAHGTASLQFQITNATDYAKFYSRSYNAVIRVFDEAGNVIETHEHAGESKEWWILG
jgi:hypothetical protein